MSNKNFKNHEITPHALQDLLAGCPRFDLLEADLLSLEVDLELGNLDPEEATASLALFQRLLRLHPSWPTAEALHAAGFTSAHEIAALPEHQFILRQGPNLDGLDDMTGHELARRIHRRAADVVERVRLHAMNLLALQPGNRSSAMLPNNAPPRLLHFYQGLPSYQELFGSLNYLGCDECRSIWSPAAYFVDLMRLIDGYVSKPATKPLSLRDRRPDLWQVPLDCVAAENEMPYLEIVNGILEATIEVRQPSTSRSGKEKPQQTPATFQVAAAIYPFLLPYNHPLEQIRALLEHFHLSLAGVYEVLRVDATIVAYESLELSPDQVLLLTTPRPDAEHICRAYGLDAGADPVAELSQAEIFLSQTGLNTTELNLLIYQNLRRRPTENEVDAEIPSRFFINQGLSGKFLEITPLGSENGKLVPLNQEIENLDLDALDAMNRFIRLAQHLGWTFADLDLALRSVATPPVIDKSTLQQLATIVALAKVLRLPVDETCAMWSDLSTIGIGNENTPEDLFDRIFNLPTPFFVPDGQTTAPPYRPKYSADPLWDDPILHWDTADRASSTPRQIRNRLRAAFSLNDQDLTLLIEDLIGRGIIRTVPNDPLIVAMSVANLTILFRYSRLARSLHLPIATFLDLLRFSGCEKIDSIDSVQAIVDTARLIARTSLDLYQVEYLTSGIGNRNFGPGYSPKGVASMLAGLAQSSVPVQLNPQSFVEDGRLNSAESATLFQALVDAEILDAAGIVRAVLTPVPQDAKRTVFTFNPTSKNLIRLAQDPFAAKSANLTVAAWVLADELSPGNVIAGGVVEGRLQPTLMLGADGSLEISSTLGSPQALCFEDFFQAGEWVHVAWVSTGDAWIVYRNGELVKPSKPCPLPLVGTPSAYSIGASGDAEFWSGSIANFGIWQKALNPGQVAALVLAQTEPSVATSPAHYWVIDDDVAEGGAVADIAGNAPGTLEGSVDRKTQWPVVAWPADPLAAALTAQNALVTTHLAAFLKADQELIASALSFSFKSRGDKSAQANQVLASGTAENARLIAGLDLNLQAASALHLTPAEITGLASDPTAFGLSFGTDFRFTLENLAEIADFKRLTTTFADSKNQLLTYFALAGARPETGKPGKIEPIETPDKLLAEITGWPLDQIVSLEDKAFWPGDWKFDTVTQVTALKACFDASETLGIDIEFLVQLRDMGELPLIDSSTESNWNIYLAAARDLLEAIGATFGADRASQAQTAILGQIEEKRRDVFVSYLLFVLTHEFADLKTPDDLYDYLLTDIEMSSIVQIPLLKEGLNALQLYVETTQMDLEAEVANQIPKKWWTWMQHYRVWQANREIFLYPENYVDPTLLNTKSPQFAQLESDLHQGNLTPELVTSALTSYLEGMAEMAQLQIAASYRAKVGPASSDTLFLFGRTRTDPPTFYFRSVQIGPENSLEGVTWTPWQPIGLSIHAEEISVVYAFERLFVFWVEQTTKTINVPPGADGTSYQVTTATPKYSFQKLGESWSAIQTLSQSLVINVSPPTPYQVSLGISFPAASTRPPWTRPTVLKLSQQALGAGSSGEEILVAYGPLLLPTSTKPAPPATMSSKDLDSLNTMLYESALLTTETSELVTSLVPAWTLNDVLTATRKNLQVDPEGKSYILGMLRQPPFTGSTNNDETLLIKSPDYLYAMRGSPVDLAFSPRPDIDTLASYFPLNEGKGSTLHDLVRGTSVKAETETLSWQTCSPATPFAESRNFAITFSEPALTKYPISLSGDAFTVGFWLWKGDPLSNQEKGWTIVSLEQCYGDNVLIFYLDKEGTLWVGTGQASWYKNIPINTEQWTHIFGTIEDGLVTIYVNGKKTTSFSSSPSNLTAAELIFYTFPVFLFSVRKVFVADISVWTRTLDAAEIEWLYENPDVTSRLPVIGNSSTAVRIEQTTNQPGWFTYDTGEESFLVIPSSGDFSPLDELTTASEPSPTLIKLAFKDEPEVEIKDLTFQFHRLNTSTVSTFKRDLLADGPGELLTLASQYMPEFSFSRLEPTAGAVPPTSGRIDFNGAFGDYFWELFFYVPFLVAETFAKDQQFGSAQEWYQYVFDPTTPAVSRSFDGWPMNDGTGTKLHDRNGSIEGVVMNSQDASWAKDAAFPYGERVVLDFKKGGDAYIAISDVVIPEPDGALTVAFWVRFDDDVPPIQALFSYFADETLIALTVWDSELWFQKDAELSYITTEQIISTKGWYHIALVLSGGLNLQGFYVNGALVQSRTAAKEEPDLETQPWTVFIGYPAFSDTPRTLQGAPSDLQIWNTALDPAEIAQVYGNYPQDRFWRFRPFIGHTPESLKKMLNNPREIQAYENDPFNPDAVARLRIGAYQKGIVMRYVKNLLAWGNNLFAQYSWETVTQATMLYTEALDLLGPAPQEVGVVPPPPIRTVEDFIKEYGAAKNIPQFLIQLENHLDRTLGPRLSGQPFNQLDAYFCVPENSQLQSLWQEADTQLYKIRHGENIDGRREPLPAYQPPISPGAAARGGVPGGGANQPSGANVPYYRFSHLIERARDFTSDVVALGAALLDALEKQDAETLDLLQNTNEIALLQMATQIKQQRIAEIEAAGQALQASLEAAQERQSTYQTWISQGVSPGEQQGLSQLQSALTSLDAARDISDISVGTYLIPTIFGFSDGGFDPGSATAAGANAAGAYAQVYSTQSQGSLTQAQFSRRTAEWSLQLALAQDDAQQIQARTLANQAELTAAQADLQIHQTKIAQAQRIQAFYQSKFTNQQLYQWMAGQLSTVYYQSYQLAFALGKDAQAAFQYEKNSEATFLDYGAWNSQKKGLASGRSLLLGLQRLEKAYMDAGVRYLEIEKTISLLAIDPRAVDQLRSSGTCSFELAEKLFDLDFPSHYNRLIKTISVTIPAIVGPYQNLHATLTQTANRVVTKPDAKAVEYLLTGKGSSPPAIRSNWNIDQEIAISHGTDDNGVFELDFEDPRYLPFEGTGAVSSWKLEVSGQANPKILPTVTDVIIRLRYTAQDGGAAFKQAVRQLEKADDRSHDSDSSQ